MRCHDILQQISGTNMDAVEKILIDGIKFVHNGKTNIISCYLYILLSTRKMYIYFKIHALKYENEFDYVSRSISQIYFFVAA